MFTTTYANKKCKRKWFYLPQTHCCYQNQLIGCSGWYKLATQKNCRISSQGYEWKFIRPGTVRFFPSTSYELFLCDQTTGCKTFVIGTSRRFHSFLGGASETLRSHSISELFPFICADCGESSFIISSPEIP